MRDIGFIKLLDDQSHPLWLLQCDIAGHSRWFKKVSKHPPGLGHDATIVKKALAMKILEALPTYFDEVYWAGDGGLYAALDKPAEVNADSVVSAARRLLDVFKEWRSSGDPALTLDELKLRISCHNCFVWGGNDPRYWASVELNMFIKHERDLSHPDAISITQPILARMKDRSHFRLCKNGSSRWAQPCFLLR